MWRILLVLGVVPLMSGTVMAAQPLTENQMDGVTAGFATANEAALPLSEFAYTPPPPPPPTLTSILFACVSRCDVLAAIQAGGPPAPAAATPTAQFSTLISTRP